MKHSAISRFWRLYNALPPEVQRVADRQFKRLKSNPRHPSLHFKKVGTGLWSARVSIDYRVLGRERSDGIVWVWIGPHDEYDRLLN